jgi:hypothetical protein
MAHKHNPASYTDRQTVITAARNAIARLQQIEANVEGANTAQTQTAIKDMAGYERHLIRLVVGGL